MEAGSLTIEDLASPSADKEAKLIKPEGSMDESNVEKLTKQIYEVIEKYPNNLYLLFDLEKLTYINSKTIGYLFDWHEKMSKRGGKIVLTKAAPNILDTLTTIGITELVKYYPTLEQANKELFA